MYVCIHNDSDLDLHINANDGQGLMKNCKRYVDIAFCDDITFSYEKGNYDEYIRFFKRVKICNITSSDLYVNFVDDKIMVSTK